MAAFVNVVGAGSVKRESGKQSRRGSLVAMKAVRSLKDVDFKESVLQSDKPVLVDFYATWCGPCKLISPLVDWAGVEYKDNLEVFKVNVDEEPEYVSKYQVNALPHLVLFENGEDVMHVTGLVKKGKLADQIEKHIL
uniref:Thioredoxin domain-containing protein n=1 Tax=Rhodosorus marinus TaxID=101924 RepID=A0A7S0BV52_9RHOD